MTHTDSTADEVKRKASELAQDAKDAATEAARQEAEDPREGAIDQAETAAEAARAAESEFDRGSLQAAALGQIGQQIENVAASLRDKPAEEMFDDVAIFARRNPMLFLGGAALLGFAAARFMKSGNAAPRNDYAAEDPWSGHLGGDAGRF
ncbi:hypothetical protein [Marivita sp. GX14005]|uniref:hypothetical protein n=1 Tax=Marivita sp. GX14005 TaxID=2942276 RepID=UPI002018C5CB|nr:hypothetical protein [Marivita sp. GX14005]MCL3880741.1 hypothetical protein [Marivita sp. GX14005]